MASASPRESTSAKLAMPLAARGGVKDLRHMTPATHAAFLAIVLEGARAANGMASFADVLSRGEAEAIHHYLISRARDDWED